jgi:hypothetical protein
VRRAPIGNRVLMALLKHFDYIPDQADTNVRFELRSQGPGDDGEPRIGLTVVDVESGDDDGNLTIQLSPPDLEGLIDVLEQSLEELAPAEEGVDEMEEEEQPEEAEEPEPARPARRSRGSKKQAEEDEE